MKAKKRYWRLLIFLMFLSFSSHAQIIYVNQNATGNNDGSSWAHAFLNLQDGLAQVTAGIPSTIWVAAGSYKPTNGSDREISFEIPDKLKIHGGFVGNEPTNYDLALRDFVLQETILTGNIGSSAVATDNSYHVVYTENVSSQTIFDGFTVRDGRADGAFQESYGGGWYNNGSNGGNSNPSIGNCLFKFNFAENYGGALYNAGYEGGDSSPMVTNCTFLDNEAVLRGGAMYNSGYEGNSSPTLTGCIFLDNEASKGGAMYNNGLVGNSSPILTNCTFLDNTALLSGGAITNSGFSGHINLSITNCFFSRNEASSIPGAIFFSGYGSGKANFINTVFENNGAAHISYFSLSTNTQPSFFNCTFYGATTYAIEIRQWSSSQTPIDFVNCIFWDNNGDIVGTSNASHPEYGDDSNVNIRYSIVEEASFVNPLNHNINKDPIFVNVNAGDFSLKPCSPAIDAGAATNAPLDDVLENARPYPGTLVDIGAYEYQGHLKEKRYVNKNVSGGNQDGSSWANAFTELYTILNPENVCQAGEVWVAVGSYNPTNGTDKTISFNIPDELKLYGGFVGNEPDNYNLRLRDFNVNETILSGAIGASSSSYHVIYTKDVSAETVVDGFSISGGWAKGSAPDNNGGGWFNRSLVKASNPSINNCIFNGNIADNNGGGIYNWSSSGGEASPIISNCDFFINIAFQNGGALFNNGGINPLNGTTGNASPVLTNCYFSTNNSFADGGAIYNMGVLGVADISLDRCTFFGNISQGAGSGSAIYFNGSAGSIKASISNTVFAYSDRSHIGYNDGDVNRQPLFKNCTFLESNTSVIDIQDWSSGQTPVDFVNCIFWNNNNDIVSGSAGSNDRVNISYSIVEEAAFAPANHNINKDPLLATTGVADRNYSLKPCSPAIDAGLANAQTEDVLGNARPFAGTTIDIGAYEYQGLATLNVNTVINANLNHIVGQSITGSANILSPRNVLFRSGKNIVLNPGFEAKAGAIFRAEISGCL